MFWVIPMTSLGVPVLLVIDVAAHNVLKERHSEARVGPCPSD